MITDDMRRETANRLREKKKEFFGKRRWFPQDLTSYQSMYLTAIDECLPDGECGFDVLADLIDRPTCKIILARELRTASGKPITGINGYMLSCGHQAVGFEKPRYCPECGMEVGE